MKLKQNAYDLAMDKADRYLNEKKRLEE